MQLVFFAYITMKKLFLFLFLVFTSVTFAQQTYKLYVEGEKQWAYRENALTDFVYAFCTKDFEAIAKNPVVGDSLKVALLESIYDKMLQSIPTKDKDAPARIAVTILGALNVQTIISELSSQTISKKLQLKDLLIIIFHTSKLFNETEPIVMAKVESKIKIINNKKDKVL